MSFVSGGSVCKMQVGVTKADFISSKILELGQTVKMRSSQTLATVGEQAAISDEDPKSTLNSKTTITTADLEAVQGMVANPNDATFKKAVNLKMVEMGVLQNEKNRDMETLALKTIQVSENRNFEGFTGICHDKIETADKWLPELFAYLFVASDNNVNVREEKMILATFYPHREEMKAYLETLKTFPALIDQLTFLFVPIQVKSLIVAISEMYGKPVAITLKLEGMVAKNAALKSYVDRWSTTVVDYQKYQSFGTLYYNELSEQVYPIVPFKGDDALGDKTLKDSGGFTKKLEMKANKEYGEDLKALNPHICGVLREIIYTFAGEQSRKSLFESKVKMTYETQNDERIEFRVFSVAFLNAFWPTLVSVNSRAEKCQGSDPKDLNSQIVEMIFFARTGK